MSDIVDGLQDIEQAVNRVEEAVNRVEEAAKSSTSFTYLLWFVIGWYVIGLPAQIWHSKWRYSAAYGVPSEKVHVDDKPHDCAFLAAPLGEKYCSYVRIVSTSRWATSTTGNPIVSYDDGKTWTIFEPAANVRVPHDSTVEEVFISWVKKDDD